jgi:hypothetical protein
MGRPPDSLDYLTTLLRAVEDAFRGIEEECRGHPAPPEHRAYYEHKRHELRARIRALVERN